MQLWDRKRCFCRPRFCGCISKRLLGIGCILAGVIILLCVAPGWLLGLIAALILLALGAWLLQPPC